MELTGSCHCGAVRFSVRSAHPVPYARCYCSVCRKTAGGGGYAINLGADAKTLQVTGKEDLRIYQAVIEDPETGVVGKSPARRHFCGHCGSALWAWDPRWPDFLHPFASAIDCDLPPPPERVHLMLVSKANWVEVEKGPNDQQFDQYPEESLAQWHERLGLTAQE